MRQKKSKFVCMNLKIIKIDNKFNCDNRLSTMLTHGTSCNEIASTIMSLFAKARQRRTRDFKRMTREKSLKSED